jgi:hypothetical protein
MLAVTVFEAAIQSTGGNGQGHLNHRAEPTS